MSRFETHLENPTGKPYVIAEIGVNHEGSLHEAKRLVKAASDAGASCAKFQTYKAETIVRQDAPAYWSLEEEPTRSQFELFKKFDLLSRADYEDLADYCGSLGMDFASTPFDLDAVTWLSPLVPFFKVASADITNTPLLRAVAKEGKPILISTGASNLDEIDGAVSELRHAGASQIVIMHCVLNYPTLPKDANLGMIRSLTKEFPDMLVGYSDHTKADSELTALTIAYSLGASILEKHFTLDKNLRGNDHYHSMDDSDLSRFILKIDLYHSYLGKLSQKQSLASEEKARLHARRSIVAKKDIPAQKTLEESDLVCLRPGDGISPQHWDEVVGSVATVQIRAGSRVDWEMLRRVSGVIGRSS